MAAGMSPDGQLIGELAAEARRAARGAYAPYSRFRVGAVAAAGGGGRWPGANVENAAYGSSICAEANAISTAAAGGIRRIEGVAVACVDAPGADGAYPCGNCRQMMNEFAVEWVIVTAGEGTEVRFHPFEELHPHGFAL